ncbi:3-methyladenine DNA glycosylase AlkD [Sagittula marina]|uniref:3-methyladenine DNA glycosylase AlkD n=1 Tax=Sagittula marina TaxID=943940 RepID=A0A7W6DX23_9RHOB|nr:3-methyladenine DNA glycosylase AlkD [Sagittula marina]
MTQTFPLPEDLTPDTALAALEAAGDPEKSVGMASYHKATRRYLGTAMPQLNALVKEWRDRLTLDQRLALAAGLWDTDVHEARIAAAKLLAQARMRPSDEHAWQLIQSWVPQFDGWAVADHAASSGGRRIMADLSRLHTLEDWTTSDHLWSKRAALVMTLPLALLNHPNSEQLAARERVLAWMADYTTDQRWFIQKAVAWWLRDLSGHDAARCRMFLAEHGSKMKPFAHKDAARKLPGTA